MKRKRIIIYYVLAIFLPCLFLGIIAFRGIKNDQAVDASIQERGRQIQVLQFLEAQRNPKVSI